MAEPVEDIIIIEESDAADFTAHPQDEEVSTNAYPKIPRKKLFILIGASVFILLLVLLLIVLFSSSSKPQEIQTLEHIEDKLKEKAVEKIEPNKLEQMIAKANYLYSSGSKAEALVLYEKIAHYSEAISLYNLGVAQLIDKQYDTALKTFKQAIQNNEKKCVSALNAAVCCIHLKDEKSFHYYIDLAYAYLPSELQSPLYSYYYTLINYYKHNYFEALSALKNPTSQEYVAIQNDLATRINALFSNNYAAIEAMENTQGPRDSFSLGLLYARIGDLTLAIKYLEDALVKNIEPIKAQVALALVNLKAGRVETASKELDTVTDMFGEDVYKPYPIKVTLKNSLFDTQKAQNRYRNTISKSKNVNYQKLFYFSPYKIFNADQTISYIRKGNANIFIDNIDSAQEYLKRSISSSGVNRGIVNAIKKALDFRIREANSELEKLVLLQPKHSILHYNLALTYAQLGNMQDAHKHFLRSYHLDAKNYLSGIYAVMTSQLIHQENQKMKSFLTEAIANEEENEEIVFYKTLIQISENNFFASSEWLHRDYKEKPLYLAMDSIIASFAENQKTQKEVTQKLIRLLPNDILPHMMYIDAHFKTLKDKEYAYEVQNYLNDQSFHFDDLYFGPSITRYLYVQQNLITGKLYYLIQQLKETLATTREYTHEITAGLALASLYNQNFEESYTLYNQMIDTLKIQDSHTLFLGAVASTAAEHHENAIALLELSKLKDAQNLESRYALGLLYLQVKNNKGAVIQLSRVGDSGFNSEFFNFDIDLDTLLVLKRHEQK
jgi:Flp pilus assembly protein TadD